MVFSGSGWTVVKLQAALADSWGKVKEGAMFFTRGMRLLGSDITGAGRLFSRAVLGTLAKHLKSYNLAAYPQVHGFLKLDFYATLRALQRERQVWVG